MKEDINFLPEVDRKKNDKIINRVNQVCKTRLPIILAGLLFLTVLLFSIIFLRFNSSINTSKKKIDNLEKKNLYLEQELSKYEKNGSQEKNTNESTSTLISRLPYYVRDEWFYINKASISENNELYMDIRTTSKYSSFYLDNGTFRLKNTDLKLKLYDLIKNINKSYNEKKKPKMSALGEFLVKLYVGNYEIASYENGSIKLVSEK